MLKEYLEVRGDQFDDLGYNLRFIELYQKLIPEGFCGPVLDVGSGNGGFVRACFSKGRAVVGIDWPTNFEWDKLPCSYTHYRTVHLNAVIEHLHDPENILKEIYRALIPQGVLIINTPNFRLDYKNFYNDPTHKHPYTPESLSMLVKMFGFKIILCEPALIRRSPLWWKVPFKWKVASWLPKGSRSILLIARKP